MVPTLPVCPTSLWAALSFPYITAALLISQLDILQEKVVTRWCYQQQGYCHFCLHCLCSEPPQVEILAFPSMHLWIVNRCSRTAEEQHRSDLAQLHQASASSWPSAFPWLSPLHVFWHQTQVMGGKQAPLCGAILLSLFKGIYLGSHSDSKGSHHFFDDSKDMRVFL